ncbi:copper chaperone PCu(A)C [Streptomyces sp. NPDC048392]|uniref:copper chaperone PCu(A)C n=1 Tax=Streptomyces sp. NPDC048392 TaxID=3365543 RepID=UPI00371D1E8D
MTALFAVRRRCALAASALVLAMTANGCGGDDEFSLPDWEAPGQNGRVGDLMIRYAHVAEPKDEPWQSGDDVPAYVWLYNKGDKADKLVGAETPAAASVDLVDADGKVLTGGVELPVGRLVQLEPGKTHLVLRDVNRQIRGGDFMEFTMRFEKAGTTTFNIQAQVPTYEESPSPTG